jgi:hypothetical protein
MAIKKSVLKSGGGEKTEMVKRGGKMAKTVKAQKKRELVIDYPKAGEAVWSGHYAVRISAPASAVVEARVDAGAWMLCRSEAGYWWLDMSGLADGEHELAARLISNGDSSTALRKFKVAH